MVTIVNYRKFQREDETEFFVLVVQGGLEVVKSKETGKMYFTARTAKVPCTFNETMCKAFIGIELEGSVEKVETEPYEYPNSETGEIMTLTHRYEFVSIEDEVMKNHVIEDELVD